MGILLILLLLGASDSVIAQSGRPEQPENYKYKELTEFDTLSSFSSVEKFEAYYGVYIKDCLDNTYGGTMGIPCLIGYGLWDRELNVYYKKLMNVLKGNEKDLLKESQLAWIKERDQSIAFNSHLLDSVYKDKSGTMYALMRADDADKLITPVVRHRALLLKAWLEFIEKPSLP